MLSFSSWPAILLLPLPWLIRKFITPAPSLPTQAIRVPFYKIIEQTVTQTNPFSVRSSQLLVFGYLIWALLITAAMDPIWLGKPIDFHQSGRDLLVAVDISGSMDQEDLILADRPASRLSVVKHVLSDFIQQRTKDRIGLILFGSQAYLQAPLTFDHRTVTHFLQEAEIGLAGPQTALGDAIGLAIKKLKDRPTESRVLILLTDGSNTAGNISPLQAAQLAAQEKLKIYTIGVGASQMVVPGLLGFGEQVVNPASDLDEKTLQVIAQKTGGRYFRADNTETLKNIYDQLNQLEPENSSAIVYRPHIALFYWPLSIAFVLSLLLGFILLILNQRRAA